MKPSQYDEQAAELEAGLQGRIPLVRWHVLRYEEIAYEWEQMPNLKYEEFRVTASVMINQKRLFASTIVTRPLIESAKFNVIEYVAESMGWEFVKAILAWRPD